MSEEDTKTATGEVEHSEQGERMLPQSQVDELIKRRLARQQAKSDADMQALRAEFEAQPKTSKIEEVTSEQFAALKKELGDFKSRDSLRMCISDTGISVNGSQFQVLLDKHDPAAPEKTVEYMKELGWFKSEPEQVQEQEPVPAKAPAAPEGVTYQSPGSATGLPRIMETHPRDWTRDDAAVLSERGELIPALEKHYRPGNVSLFGHRRRIPKGG
jgi:hypothetical protein